MEGIVITGCSEGYENVRRNSSPWIEASSDGNTGSSRARAKGSNFSFRYLHKQTLSPGSASLTEISNGSFPSL